MRYAGFGLFVIGLIVASWYASYVPEGVGAERIGNWASAVGLPFGLGWVTMIVGVVLARMSGKADSLADEAAPGAADNAAEAMKQVQLIATHIDDLARRELTAADVAAGADALAAKLDVILTEEVPVFLDARPLIIERYGLEAFAELIGHFAVMERAAARAWSAITDEAWDEVPPSLVKAQAAIHRALDVSERVAAARTPSVAL